MSVQQAVQFLRLLEQKTGRKGAIYSGNRLKEHIGRLNANDRAYVAQHRLWLCQYGPHAVLPIGFTQWWLWQFTGDGVGPQPHTVPGIIAGNGGLDLNAYQGDKEKLASEWAPGAVAADAQQYIASTHSMQAEQDDEPTQATDPQPAAIVTPPDLPLNVQPQKAAYSLDIIDAFHEFDREGGRVKAKLRSARSATR